MAAPKDTSTVDIQKLIAAAQRGEASMLDIMNAREGASPEMQAILGPLEHRAFTREAMQQEALKLGLPVAASIPAYTAGKAIARGPASIGGHPLTALPYIATRAAARSEGLHKTRSPASIEEMRQGYIGMLEGLLSKLPNGGSDDMATIPTDKKGKPKNSQYDLSDPEQLRKMLERASPERNTPTKQYGEGTPYGEAGYRKMVRNQPELGGKGDPRFNHTLAEEVALNRKSAGLPSAEEILSLIFANNPKLARK